VNHPLNVNNSHDVAFTFWSALIYTSKVRQPVICCNNHVFCSNCIKVWLEKSSQCPTCRVAITPENPCREIIGNNETSQSYLVVFFFSVSYETLFVLGKMSVIKYLSFFLFCVCVYAHRSHNWQWIQWELFCEETPPKDSRGAAFARIWGIFAQRPNEMVWLIQIFFLYWNFLE